MPSFWSVQTRNPKDFFVWNPLYKVRNRFFDFLIFVILTFHMMQKLTKISKMLKIPKKFFFVVQFGLFSMLSCCFKNEKSWFLAIRSKILWFEPENWLDHLTPLCPGGVRFLAMWGGNVFLKVISPPFWRGLGGKYRGFPPPILEGSGGEISRFPPPFWRGLGGKFHVFPPHVGGNHHFASPP